MEPPKINTAIPQRRYQLGEYTAVVLGEIESGDDRNYRYILALVREGETRPGFFVTAEKNPRRGAGGGSYRLHVFGAGFDEDMGSSDEWKDLELFTHQALAIAARVLGLADEEPVRLM